MEWPALLAAVDADDADERFRRKATLVAGDLDGFVARSMLNGHDFRYASLEHRLFALARDIRETDVETLAKRLLHQPSPRGRLGISVHVSSIP